MLGGAIIVGLGAGSVAFAVGLCLEGAMYGTDGKIVLFVPRWYFLAVVGALVMASSGPLGCE